MKKQFFISLMLLVVLVISALPTVTHAQTYYTVTNGQYQPRTAQEMIVYLQNLIVQLQAQLAAQNNNGMVLGASTYNYGYNNSSNNYYSAANCYSNGYYCTNDPNNYSYNYNYSNGYNYNYNRYNVDVTTDGTSNVRDDEATLRGSIDLNGTSYARVWFEFGESSRLDDKTRVLTISNYGDDTRTFSILAEDLHDDEIYYYRAVAEDPQGRRDYGSIRTFRTDDNGGSHSGSFDEPQVETGDAYDIEDDRASIDGEVDLNDADSGRAFIIFGTDEGDVDDATDEDEYSDIDRHGDDLNKTGTISIYSSRSVDVDFDLYGLDDDTRYYFVLCVEYDDDDDDSQLECGDIDDFRTDN